MSEKILEWDEKPKQTKYKRPIGHLAYMRN